MGDFPPRSPARPSPRSLAVWDVPTQVSISSASAKRMSRHGRDKRRRRNGAIEHHTTSLGSSITCTRSSAIPPLIRASSSATARRANFSRGWATVVNETRERPATPCSVFGDTCTAPLPRSTRSTSRRLPLPRRQPDRRWPVGCDPGGHRPGDPGRNDRRGLRRHSGLREPGGPRHGGHRAGQLEATSSNFIRRSPCSTSVRPSALGSIQPDRSRARRPVMSG